MKAREGDFIQIRDRLFFDVKGMVHPPDRIVAFPRYVPDPSGNRRLGDTTYKKVYGLSARYRLLEDRFPQYLVSDPVFGGVVCEVPKSDVEHHLMPVNRLGELRRRIEQGELEANTLALIEFLHDHSGVSWNNLGISGSILARLHTPESDIDPIVYGRKNSLNVYNSLKQAFKIGETAVRPYTPEELRSLYTFRVRDTEMGFAEFVEVERRKVLQGKFQRHDFYIRCVKDLNEVDEQYGDIVYRKVGYSKVKAAISDDSESTLTPCRYFVDNVRVLEGNCDVSISEIVSFRGRFCEQARSGETVTAQGTVEKVKKNKTGAISFRLLIGGKPLDFMVLSR